MKAVMAEGEGRTSSALPSRGHGAGRTIERFGTTLFGCCATDLRLIRYSYFGTYATLPGVDRLAFDEG
jgi:hypothetical protein